MRKKRPLERKDSLVRDATLVIIASEDRYAVKQYFEFFRSTRIQFRVLETTDGRSAPQHVLDRLEEYIKEFEFGEGDQFWLVCDMDHWSDPSHISNLTGVLQKCRHKGIQVALSNPCFDLWLLLHFSDAPDDNRGPTCNVIEAEIRKVVGQYSKTKVYDLPISMGRVRDAITRSKKNPCEEGKMPNPCSTAVHLIIEGMVHGGIISIPS